MFQAGRVIFHTGERWSAFGLESTGMDLTQCSYTVRERETERGRERETESGLPAWLRAVGSQQSASNQTAQCKITDLAGGALDMISLLWMLSKTVIKEHMSSD
jgi:hypothetical protein